MKKKIKNINGFNIIWLLIYLMPFLFVLGWVVINSHSQLSSIYSLSNYIDSIHEVFNITIPIKTVLSNCLNYFGFNGQLNRYLLLVVSYITYIILVSILRILVDVLMMLPNIIHNFIDKLGGERE